MCVYAYTYVSSALNKKNQSVFNEINAGHFNIHWPWVQLTDIVSSFRANWEANSEGVHAVTDNPEISLDLSGAVIVPSIQQMIHIELKHNQSVGSQGRVKFEFSNQRQQIFYDSPTLSWSNIKSGFDLSSVSWKINKPDENQASQFIKWQEIAALDALVIRFYSIPIEDLTIKSIEINQTQLKQPYPESQLNCQSHDSRHSCYFTNQMKYLDVQMAQSGYAQQLSFSTTINHIPNWFSLLMAWLLLMMLCLAWISHKRAWAVGFITAVFLVIWGVHHQSLLIYLGYIQWFAVILMLGLIFMCRNYFKWPASKAMPVWLVSMALAVLMLFISGFNLSFVADLPQYLLWAWVQQLIIGPILAQFIHKQLGLSRLMTVCLVGVLFSIVHSPNHMLMMATLIGGVAWSYAWLRYENIYANAVSHAVLALLFYQLMPEALLGSARVGIFF